MSNTSSEITFNPLWSNILNPQKPLFLFGTWTFPLEIPVPKTKCIAHIGGMGLVNSGYVDIPQNTARKSLD